MLKALKRIRLWFSRKSYLPLIVVGGAMVALLYFDDDTSVSQNMEYEHEIRRLKAEIKLHTDSAEYFRQKRQSLLSGGEELEHIAREQYHMQRPSEDVFIIKTE